MLPIEFLKWSLTMLLVMCCCHAAAGNWHLCVDVEWQRKEKRVKKQPGCTWIEVNNKVHRFVVEDQDHLQMIEIQAELQIVNACA